ncbi:hypothetical protein HZA97_08565 [Candidatus Woesearchaeota archaeon]|nr:hypothetical protein [Candidatus Woesearchaeota archaeon]
MQRKVDCWYGLNCQDKTQGGLVSIERKAILCIGPSKSDEVLVVQYHHKRTGKKWITVQGFIVEREETKNSYGLSRNYTLEEKEEIKQLIENINSLEGKVEFDEGGTRIV